MATNPVNGNWLHRCIATRWFVWMADRGEKPTRSTSRKTSCRCPESRISSSRNCVASKEEFILSKLEIEYPENLPDVLQTTRARFEQEAKMAMAVKLFEMRRLSSGMAADLVGMDRVSFLLRLRDFGVPMIDLDADELAEDIANA